MIYYEEIIISASGKTMVNTVTFHNHPKADFTFELTNLVLTVDASNSRDVGLGKIIYYLWDWDDGTLTLQTKPTATHTYEQEGAYNVKLIVGIYSILVRTPNSI